MKVFKLINQIKMVGTFSQIIFIFGRYYPHCEFIIDFNILIAKDVRGLYQEINSLMKCINK